jgi:hypothetical protein
MDTAIPSAQCFSTRESIVTIAKLPSVCSSYTPLVIAIQQMLEYDNNNHIPDGKVRHSLRLRQLHLRMSRLVT